MLELSALGEIAARIDGRPLDLGGALRRGVLALLIAAEGRVVSTDRIVEDLWAGDPPPKALGALQAYVSQLRRELEPERAPREPARVIVSVAPGYRLAVPDDAVDVWRFARLVDRASRATDPTAAFRFADEALALWVADPFAGYPGQEWAELARTRLTSRRSLAVETRADAALRLGRTGGVVLDLTEHVRTHPLREQAVGLLALALYREGRQGDALAVIAAARAALADELGLDPGPALRTLETDILAQHARLDRPAAERTVVLTRLAVEPPVAPPTDPGDPGDPTDPSGFVGRTAELARLEQAYGRRGARVVWVEGEAGQGKTGLLDRFAGSRPADCLVVRGRCAEVDGAPPGWTWHEITATVAAGAARSRRPGRHRAARTRRPETSWPPSAPAPPTAP